MIAEVNVKLNIDYNNVISHLKTIGYDLTFVRLKLSVIIFCKVCNYNLGLHSQMSL